MPINNVKLRATDFPDEFAKRLVYKTRRLLPDDDPQKRQPLREGNEFEAAPSEAEFYIKHGWAEEVEPSQAYQAARAGAKKKSEAAVNRRQSPRQQQSDPRQSKPSPSPTSSEDSAQESKNQDQAQSQPQQLEEMTRAELLELAEKHGVELPAGYVAHGELVEALKNAGVSGSG
jgi:hypothetical protein